MKGRIIGGDIESGRNYEPGYATAVLIDSNVSQAITLYKSYYDDGTGCRQE